MRNTKIKSAEMKSLRDAVMTDAYLLDGVETGSERYGKGSSDALVESYGIDEMRDLVEFVINDPEVSYFEPAHLGLKHGGARQIDDAWILRRWSSKYKRDVQLTVWRLYSAGHLTIDVQLV